MKILDMPKIQSPFIRKMVDGSYVVTPEVAEGYGWVFEDDDVVAVEKLDGTNVSVVIEDGVVKHVFNRTARIPFFNKGKKFIIEGVLNSFERGYLDLTDGQYFGELIGPKLNQNPYDLDEHLWIPFSTYALERLRYTSWGKYPKDFKAISSWFEHDLFSLFIRKRSGEVTFPEGIVFTHSDGRMAKLRRDMFPWFRGNRHKALETLIGEDEG